MKSMQLSLCALLMFITGCVHVTSDWDPKADFSALSTYRFTAPPPESPLMNSLYNDDLYQTRVRKAIAQDLASKGFRAATDGEAPTFRVAFFRVVDKKVSYNSVNTFMGYSGSTWYGGANYGADMGGSPVFGTNTVVNQYTQSTLLVDVLNPKGALIWRGTGASRLADPKKPDAQQKSISDEVTQILKKFPPGITPKS